MRRRSSLILAPCLVILCVSIFSHHAYAGGPDIFLTPVPNAPFSALVSVQRSIFTPNGSVFNFKSIREVARDSRGRIHNEARAEEPASNTDTPRLLRVHLYDPQTRISTFINPAEKTFSTSTVNHAPSTVPPSIRYAPPSGENLPQNEFAKEEDLGVRDMEGVQVRGLRQTQTIPGESSGTRKEVVITDETWYSEDLRINLMVEHSDPSKGTVTLTVTQIVRTEPDPAVFEVPAGYTPAGAKKSAE